MTLTYHLSYFVLKVMVQNFTCRDKQILDILSCLRGGLKMELYALFALKGFDPVYRHLSLILHVLFVSNEEDYHAGFALGHDLVVPGRQILKSV